MKYVKSKDTLKDVKPIVLYRTKYDRYSKTETYIVGGNSYKILTTELRKENIKKIKMVLVDKYGGVLLKVIETSGYN